MQIDPKIRQRLAGFIVWLILIVGFLGCADRLISGWQRSILDLHSFRQSQTAISAYYFLKDGFCLNYETPVFGRPWSIPFEFPLYQYLVALVTMTGVFSLDQAGRFVSLTFWLACIAPLYLLLRNRLPDLTSFLAILLIIWSTPTNLIWPRCFMIESCAMFFSLFYIYYIIRLAQQATLTGLFWTIFFGTLGALVKATTFIIILAPTLLVISTLAWKQRHEPGFLKKGIGFLGLGLLVPLSLLHFWTEHADFIKSQNPVGKMLTSECLPTWNFGSFAEKISFSTWAEINHKDFGYGFGRHSNFILIVGVLIILAAIITNQYRKEILLSIMAFFMGPMIFTNLFYIHEYYLYESDLYGEIALGLALVGLTSRLPLVFRHAVLYGLVIVITWAGFKSYHRIFLTSLKHVPFAAQIQQELKPLTEAGKDTDVVLVYGHSWDSSLAYYSQRRCIMDDPIWIPDSTLEEMISSLDPSEKIAAVVIAGPKQQDVNFINQTLKRFNLNEAPLQTSWGEIFIRK